MIGPTTLFGNRLECAFYWLETADDGSLASSHSGTSSLYAELSLEEGDPADIQGTFVRSSVPTSFQVEGRLVAGEGEGCVEATCHAGPLSGVIEFQQVSADQIEVTFYADAEGNPCWYWCEGTLQAPPEDDPL